MTYKGYNVDDAGNKKLGPNTKLAQSGVKGTVKQITVNAGETVGPYIPSMMGSFTYTEDLISRDGIILRAVS